MDWVQKVCESCAEAAASIDDSFPEWTDFAEFCRLRERGLRHDSFRVLERFVAGIEATAFSERQRFVRWLYERPMDKRQMLLPHPLKVRVVDPTLEEWTQREPDDALPHVWIGGLDHLKKAVSLDPSQQEGVTELVRMTLNCIHFELHELPRGFLGDSPANTRAGLLSVRLIARHIVDTEKRNALFDAIDYYRELAESYADYLISTAYPEIGFEEWAAISGRRCQLGDP